MLFNIKSLLFSQQYTRLSTITHSMSQSQIPIVILDANAFITGSGLLDIASNHQLITTSEVMDQLRDVKTRQMLQKFLFKIQQRQPQKKSIQFIKQFAKKTGDIASLSDVDINLLALAHTLYIKKGLDTKLRTTPPPMKEKQQAFTNQHYQQESEDEQEQEQDGQKCEQTQEIIEKSNEQKQSSEQANNSSQKNEQAKDKDKVEENDDDGWIVVPKSKPKKKQQSDDDMDEDEGWITPKNYDRKMAQGPTFVSNQVEEQQETQSFGISLMTADYAMQNVALQVGLQIKSLDGRRIKQVRRFILQCYLCWKQYKVEDNLVKLCKQCGYNSLSKIAYSINPKGQIILHRKKGWKPNQKVLQWKQKKYEQQQKKKKHQHDRRKKQPSIFDA